MTFKKQNSQQTQSYKGHFILIKSVCEKTFSVIILNGEGSNASLTVKNKKECSFLCFDLMSLLDPMSTPFPVLMWDPVSSLNPKWHHSWFLGFSREEMSLRSIDQIYAEDPIMKVIVEKLPHPMLSWEGKRIFQDSFLMAGITPYSLQVCLWSQLEPQICCIFRFYSRKKKGLEEGLTCRMILAWLKNLITTK